MAARFYPDILVVLRADLAQLEGAPHLAVQLVLFLRDRYVILGRGLVRPGQIRIHRPSIGIQITERGSFNSALLGLPCCIYLQSLSVAIQQGLDEALVLGYRLQDLPVGRDVTDGPLPQPGAGQPENVTARLADVPLESRLHLVVR